MYFANRLVRYQFERFVLDIAIATLKQGGVTSRLATYHFLEPIDAWGLPKYPERTRILHSRANIAREVRHFIQTNEGALREPDTWLGTWINPETQRCYLDITLICPCLEEARREARQRSQQGQRPIVALYNFKQKRTLYLEQPDETCAF